MQFAEYIIPKPVEKVPTPHGLQLPEDVPPGELKYVPVGQDVQFLASIIPNPDWNVPAEHALQFILAPLLD